MESTVVRCAEGHEFSTSTFPMQNLGADRIGPGRLLRCPRCARLRQAVPVPVPKSAPAHGRSDTHRRSDAHAGSYADPHADAGARTYRER
ncbi:hypothetical protein [Streptomyces sp. NPDC054784]